MWSKGAYLKDDPEIEQLLLGVTKLSIERVGFAVIALVFRYPSGSNLPPPKANFKRRGDA